MADKTYVRVWSDIIALLRPKPRDTVVHVSVDEIAHPLDAGMRRLAATAEEQRPQFVRVVDENLASHVLVCGEWYYVRLYEYESPRLAQSSPVEVIDRDSAPAREPETPFSFLANLIEDHPGLTLGCAAFLGAIAGAGCSTKKQRGTGAAAGGGCGLLVGLAMVAVEAADKSPRTSEVAQWLFATLAAAGIARRPAGRVIRLTPRARPNITTGAASGAKAKKKNTRSNEIPI